MVQELLSYDFNLVSNGSDNHLILIDLRNKEISGKKAEKALEKAGITVNKNMVPFDDKSPFITSGIRVGTPALTTRGFKEDEMKTIAGFINKIVSDPKNDKNISQIKNEIKEISKRFPLYKNQLEEI